MIVKLENLKKGDEIMIAGSSRLIFAKVIREPTLRWKKKDATGVRAPWNCTWGENSGKQLFSNLKCKVKIKIVTIPNKYCTGGFQTFKEYDNSLEEYNDEKYFDLNFRDVWLLDN